MRDEERAVKDCMLMIPFWLHTGSVTLITIGTLIVFVVDPRIVYVLAGLGMVLSVIAWIVARHQRRIVLQRLFAENQRNIEAWRNYFEKNATTDTGA